MTKEELIKLLNDPEITDDWTEHDLIDYVTCLKEVSSTLVDDDPRWWHIWESVYETKSGKYIKYIYPVSTGDNTPSELGYEGYGLEDLSEVFRTETITYTYK